MKISESEIAEHIIIASELCAKYNLPLEWVTRESAIKAITEGSGEARKWAPLFEGMRKRIDEKIDRDLLEVFNAPC